MVILQDLLGASPLHYACIAGHANVCELICRRVALKGVHVDKLVPQHANRGYSNTSREYFGIYSALLGDSFIFLRYLGRCLPVPFLAFVQLLINVLPNQLSLQPPAT
jgi:ankyrin repeat protein